MSNLIIKHCIYSTVDLKNHYQRLKGSNGHWFSPGAMSFFNSKIDDQVYCDNERFYFVSSEKGPNGIRAYTVRTYDPNTGEIETHEDTSFQEFKTKQQVKTFIRKVTGVRK